MDFFTDLSPIQSLFLLLLLSLAFLVGLLLGRAWINRKFKRLQKQFKERELNLGTLRAGLATLEAQQAERNSLLEIAESNLQEAQTRLQQSQKVLEQKERDLQRVLERVGQPESTVQQKQSEKEQPGQNDTPQVFTDVPSDSLTHDRLTALEEKMALLEKRNTQLQSVITALQEGEEKTGVDLGPREEDFNTPFKNSRKAKAALRKKLDEIIPRATAAEKDPLQRINGIGPFIEEQLNSIGIYTFQQISQLDQNGIELITEAIRFFPGRILRDDWVGQAKQLLN